jgi:hypothetical protein
MVKKALTQYFKVYLQVSLKQLNVLWFISML